MAEHDDDDCATPQRLRDSIRSAVAPIAAATTLTVVALTVLLVVVAASHLAYHRTIGAAIGSLICLCLAGAIWYGRMATPKHRNGR